MYSNLNLEYVLWVFLEKDCHTVTSFQVCSWFHTNCVYVPIRAFELKSEGSGCDTFLIAFPFLSREALHKSRVTALRWPSCCRHCVYYVLCMRRLRDTLSRHTASLNRIALRHILFILQCPKSISAIGLSRFVASLWGQFTKFI